MTENDLQKLLKRAVVRMRSGLALNVALRTFAAGLLLTALGVIWMRWRGSEALSVPVVTILPCAVAALAGIAAFWVARPAASLAASMLDRHAKTSDHVTTWLFLRGIDAARMSETQREFREAQRQSALRAADSIALKTHLPIAFPEWSRAIWLAIIVLLSAILIPANRSMAFHPPEGTAAIGVTAASGGAGKESSGTLREVPRVQVLSPAQMRKLELIATDNQLPAFMKTDALKELNEAIGGVSESELTPDVRQLLDMLRKDTGAEVSNSKTDGSVQFTSKKEVAQPSAAGASPAEYKAFENVEQAWASSESVFPDVRKRLDTYYGKRQ